VLITFTGDSGIDVAFDVAAAVPARRILTAPAVDRVTRIGRCSVAAASLILGTFDRVFDLLRVVGGGGITGRTSLSSSSVSSAIRLVLGVLRG